MFDWMVIPEQEHSRMLNGLPNGDWDVRRSQNSIVAAPEEFGWKSGVVALI
jgi:hypothetical protein